MVVELVKFDELFFKTIEGYENLDLDRRNSICYSIQSRSTLVGVICFVESNGAYFLKIGIKKDFRGKEIFREALKELVKKHNLTEVQSTISMNNIASIKAHKKLGFGEISKERENFLRETGFLKKDQIRMIKTFQQP